METIQCWLGQWIRIAYPCYMHEPHPSLHHPRCTTSEQPHLSWEHASTDADRFTKKCVSNDVIIDVTGWVQSCKILNETRSEWMYEGEKNWVSQWNRIYYEAGYNTTKYGMGMFCNVCVHGSGLEFIHDCRMRIWCVYTQRVCLFHWCI